MDNRRLIDAEKLLNWLDESPEASKFWITHIAPIEKHDLIEDAINQGKFDPDPIPPTIHLSTIRPGDKVRIISTADHRYINQEAVVEEIYPAPPGCAKLEGISRYFLISDLEVSHD